MIPIFFAFLKKIKLKKFFINTFFALLLILLYSHLCLLGRNLSNSSIFILNYLIVFSLFSTLSFYINKNLINKYLNKNILISFYETFIFILQIISILILFILILSLFKNEIVFQSILTIFFLFLIFCYFPILISRFIFTKKNSFSLIFSIRLNFKFIFQGILQFLLFFLFIFLFYLWIQLFILIFNLPFLKYASSSLATFNGLLSNHSWLYDTFSTFPFYFFSAFFITLYLYLSSVLSLPFYFLIYKKK